MSSDSQPSIQRFVYKRLVAGDYKKLAAQSNDGSRVVAGDTSGGGARDLRFHAETYMPVFAKMFPVHRTSARGTPIYTAPALRYRDATTDTWTACTSSFHGPTRTRPWEARLARVSRTPAFATEQVPAHPDVFLLIFQAADDTFATFITEDDLLSGSWHKAVTEPILANHRGASADDPNVRGYVDFTTGQSDHRND